MSDINELIDDLINAAMDIGSGMDVSKPILAAARAALIAAYPRWVSVEERLPHYNTRVEVWDTWTKDVYIARRVEAGWICDNPRQGDLDVSHWRELPDAPEVEG